MFLDAKFINYFFFYLFTLVLLRFCKSWFSLNFAGKKSGSHREKIKQFNTFAVFKNFDIYKILEKSEIVKSFCLQIFFETFRCNFDKEFFVLTRLPTYHFWRQ